jgi:hypothetical protein
MFCVLLSVAALLITAQRLPAPISEISETPMPSPQAEASDSKPRHSSKQKKKADEEVNLLKKQASSPAPSSKTERTQNPFAGTWVGTFMQGMWGNVETTLVINAAGTSVIEKNR